jgi:hypothetical protein
MATKLTWVDVTLSAGDVATIRRIISDAYRNTVGGMMPDNQLFTTRNIKSGIIGFDSKGMPAAVVQRLLAGASKAKSPNAPPAPRIAAAPSPAMTARDNETADSWIAHIKSGAVALESVLTDMAEWPGIVARIEAAFQAKPPMPKAAPKPPMPAAPTMPETTGPQDATAAILAALAQMGERLAMVEAKRGPGRPAKVKVA